MALLRVRVVEDRPLFPSLPCVGGLDAALQAQASESLGRACWRDVGLRVEYPLGFQCWVKQFDGELVRWDRQSVLDVAHAWSGRPEPLLHRSRGQRLPGAVIQSLTWSSVARHTSQLRAWRGSEGATFCRRPWHTGGAVRG